MKATIALTLIIPVRMTFARCEQGKHQKESCPACGAENPAEDLSCLKSEKNDIDETGDKS